MASWAAQWRFLRCSRCRACTSRPGPCRARHTTGGWGWCLRNGRRSDHLARWICVCSLYTIELSHVPFGDSVNLQISLWGRPSFTWPLPLRETLCIYNGNKLAYHDYLAVHLELVSPPFLYVTRLHNTATGDGVSAPTIWLPEVAGSRHTTSSWGWCWRNGWRSCSWINMLFVHHWEHVNSFIFHLAILWNCKIILHILWE
jgi:hypothetical protein